MVRMDRTRRTKWWSRATRRYSFVNLFCSLKMYNVLAICVLIDTRYFLMLAIIISFCCPCCHVLCFMFYEFEENKY